MTNATAVPVARHGASAVTAERGAMPAGPVADADERTRDRVLAAVLEHGPVSAAELGDLLGFTPAAVRRHLDHLSRAGVIELAFHYNEVLKNLRSPDSALAQLSEEERTKAEEALFVEMGEICLWGNATDLSLLMHLSLEEVQKLQGAESRKANQDKIIANDFPAAFKVLKDAQRSGKKDRRVDIVLDNAGFELFVDLVLAGYLLESGLATHVILHPKNIPWFVSDVVPRDFADTLNVLQNAKAFYETPGDEERAKGIDPVALSADEEKATDGVFAHWSELYAEGKITLRPNDFWTHAGSYWRMPATAPKLIEDLKESELVIFKGDLNYRKLTGDVSLFDPGPPLPRCL